MIEVATALLFDSDGNETPEQALVRELQEELGIDIKNYRHFKTYHCLEGDAHPNIKHVYTVQINKAAVELTLYEGQYHKGINLDQRHSYQEVRK